MGMKDKFSRERLKSEDQKIYNFMYQYIDIRLYENVFIIYDVFSKKYLNYMEEIINC